MNTHFYLLLLFTIILLSCTNNISNCPPTVYCNLQDPIKDILWLRDLVSNNPKNIRIYTSTYNGIEGIFIVNYLDSTNSSTTLTYYRTCDNTLLYQSGGVFGSTFPRNFDEQNTFRKQVYPK